MDLKGEIKEYARRIGIDLVGFANASPFPTEEKALRERERVEMRAPTDRTDPAVRANPQRLLPGSRTIISVGLGYTDRCGRVEPDGLEGSRGVLSTYTRGRDYHLALGEKLDTLVEFIRERAPEASFKRFVDSTPLLEKAAAARAGLGWIGKNGLLVTEKFGSFVFLGEILTDLEMEPDAPVGDKCGACAKCMEACPTGALAAPAILNAKACLSCITQTKGIVPTEYRKKLGKLLWGCDFCQEACPFNSEFVEREYPDPDGAAPRLEWILNLSGKDFEREYGNSSIGWRGVDVLQRNAIIALGNSGGTEKRAVLLDTLKDPRPEVRAHAVWTLRNCKKEECLEKLKIAFEKETDLLVVEELNNVIMRRA